jgi:hypothetical protein
MGGSVDPREGLDLERKEKVTKRNTKRITEANGR